MKNKGKENQLEISIKCQAEKSGIKKVLMALSGGPDSVSLAFALKKANFDIIALHCNFHLRGEESDRDCDFVKRFCKSHSIPLKVMDFNVKDYRESHQGESIEMACRNLRYEWFDKELRETGYDRIVTGHNEDDNIETFLLNMLRGSGTRGLKGMLTDNGKIWRPLLSFNRIFILCYLQRNNLSYVIDSTNLKSDYRRNFLRNEIIPLLKKEWKGFDTAMHRTISNLQAENKVVEHCVKEQLNGTDNELEVNKILDFPSPLLLIKRFIDKLEPFTTTPDEVLSAIKANKPHIRRWRLKRGALILRNGKLLIEMSHGKGSS